MDEFDGHPGLDGPPSSDGPEFGGEQSQQRAESLPTSEQQMLGDLGEVGVVGCGRFEESFLDFTESIPDSGNPTRPWRSSIDADAITNTDAADLQRAEIEVSPPPMVKSHMPGSGESNV